MSIFNRNIEPHDKPIEERTIPELIETVQHVNPVNSGSIIEDWHINQIARKFPIHNKGLLQNDSYWSNPHNQTSFDHGHLSHQDFIDWANGTGVVVKGNTQEQKDKFMRYEKAHSSLDLSIFIYAEHLWKLESDSETKWNYRHGRNPYSKPINMSNRRDSHAVIKATLETLVQPLLRDIKDRVEWNRSSDNDNWWYDFTRKHKDYMEAVCHTLAVGGHGYWEACNTPCEIINLAWSADLVFAKAYSIYLEEIDPGIVECIQWCQANKYEIKDNDCTKANIRN